jgi:ABC-type transport system involved in Fe-S cluster assembly fused permease/ATPase subunit
MSQSPEQLPAPPVGEQIHMPEPSLLPIVNAVGVALAIVGITISTFVTILGLIIFAVSTVIWIVKARREFDELPAEHPH